MRHVYLLTKDRPTIKQGGRSVLTASRVLFAHGDAFRGVFSHRETRFAEDSMGDRFAKERGK